MWMQEWNCQKRASLPGCSLYAGELLADPVIHVEPCKQIARSRSLFGLFFWVPPFSGKGWLLDLVQEGCSQGNAAKAMLGVLCFRFVLLVWYDLGVAPREPWVPDTRARGA